MRLRLGARPYVHHLPACHARHARLTVVYCARLRFSGYLAALVCSQSSRHEYSALEFPPKLPPTRVNCATRRRVTMTTKTTIPSFWQYEPLKEAKEPTKHAPPLNEHQSGS